MDFDRKLQVLFSSFIVFAITGLSETVTKWAERKPASLSLSFSLALSFFLSVESRISPFAGIK